MRIAMIGAKAIPAAWAEGGGGIERHVELLSQELVARGHHVTVYVRSSANPKKLKRWMGVHLVTLPTLRSKYFATIVHVALASVHVLFQKADIVHYHGVGPSTLAWIPRLFKPRSRIVVTFHSRDRFHEKWPWPARAYLAFGEWTACRFPHVTLAVSHGIQLFCRHMFGREAIYIPQGVDVSSKLPGSGFLKELGVEPMEYVITLGRLIPVKAYEDAIHAFEGVASDKKLLIIGDATEDALEYKEKLERLSIKDSRILMIGQRSGVELQQLIAHCYCMIHPSRVEGLSVAILEAMSYGRLVVMSDISANRELVDHSGIAYPVGNVRALREVLNWIFSDPLLVKIRGERAREVVKRIYSWEHVVLRMEAMYRRLFNQMN
jgi:glycosyltransferase involved in cell wall biosynthesis